MKIEIPDKILMQGNFSEKDLLIEFAVLLTRKQTFHGPLPPNLLG